MCQQIAHLSTFEHIHYILKCSIELSLFWFIKMVDKAVLAIVAIVAAVGLLGLVVIETISVQQQAHAAQPLGRGCEFTPGGNASKTRCVH
jgi:hypothetical protein